MTSERYFGGCFLKTPGRLVETSLLSTLPWAEKLQMEAWGQLSPYQLPLLPWGMGWTLERSSMDPAGEDAWGAQVSLERVREEGNLPKTVPEESCQQRWKALQWKGKLTGTQGLVGSVIGLDTGWLPIAGILGFSLKSVDGWLNLSLSATTSLTCPLYLSLVWCFTVYNILSKAGLM